MNSQAYRTIIVVVDPENRSIREYRQWIDIHGIRKILGTHDVQAQIIRMADNQVVAAYSPINFNLTDNMFTLQARDKVPLRGTTIIVGLNPADPHHSILNFTDCPFTLQDAKKLIDWITIFDS